jgi:hypothetical protein
MVVIPATYPPLREEMVNGKTLYYCPFATCERGKPGAIGYKSKGAAENHMIDHAIRYQRRPSGGTEWVPTPPTRGSTGQAFLTHSSRVLAAARRCGGGGAA